MVSVQPQRLIDGEWMLLKQGLTKNERLPFMSPCFIVWIFWICPTLLWANTLESLLTPFEAEYAVLWHGIRVGSSTESLQKLPSGHYSLESYSRPSFSLLPYEYEERSLFKVDNDTLYPLSYRFWRHEGSRQKKGLTTFDWQLHTLHRETSFPVNGRETLPEGTQDNLSFGFLLRVQLLEHGPFPITRSVENGSGIEPYTVRLLSTESLRTALGTFSTQKVEITTPNQRVTHLWLAKELLYFPVQMQQFKEGKLMGGAELKHFK